MKIKGEHTTADVKLPEKHVEDSLQDEMQELVDHEAFQNPVKFMPDTHGGLGPQAIVGFSMELGERVVPNTIGGDIGCGMTAVRLSEVDADFDDIDDLREIDSEVRDRVAMGVGEVNDQIHPFEWNYNWHDAYQKERKLLRFAESTPSMRKPGDLKISKEYAEDLFERVGISKDYANKSLGSLGSGNHFIEVAESERAGHIWVVVHSGSRNLGQKVAGYHQEKATEYQNGRVKWDEMDELHRIYSLDDGSPNWEKIKRDHEGERIQELGDEIESFTSNYHRNKNLDYLEGENMLEYLRDMIFTQVYASTNRKMMAREVANTLNAEIRETIDSPHNYVDLHDGVIRKGSTRALDQEKLVIPTNMEDGTLVCRGKGNEDWNSSAPHGAGRLGSRGWAYDEFNSREVQKRMYENGTYSKNVPTDEVPEAYKETQLIEGEIEPTVDVIDRLIPRINFKA